ncbi:MAG: orotidine-5'-phosphate decarboxylase [Candidatus Fermentibacteraceae bacterium]|nr:orotidine-5'-phosphate decarboxylase [Candidatus Fermentibacteraceae bacterium]MBN2608755.1 orotidine-5'-phosphate decarboxylase [Candidatus Fermentibacteraceae bacterium]
METRLYVALTSRDIAGGSNLLGTLAGLPVGMKVGLELFVSRGPSLLDEIRDAGFPLFLDLKFHDIPHTVAGAVRSACRYAPSLLNIHASGGMEMMRAAADAVRGDTRILAVTVLTSLSGRDLSLVGLRGDPAAMVTRMAEAARDSGIHGVVCSPMEASAVREVTGPDFLIVTPGIRPAGSDKGDQKRTSTPLEAVMAGATALVVGRPVTMALEPRSAAESLLSEIKPAFGER